MKAKSWLCCQPTLSKPNNAEPAMLLGLAVGTNRIKVNSLIAEGFNTCAVSYAGAFFSLAATKTTAVVFKAN